MKARKWLVKLEWGGANYYVDNNLSPYCWNGGVTIENGTLKQLYRLDIAICGHGIRSDRRYRVSGSSWQSFTKDNMDGVLLELEGTEETIVKVFTMQKSFAFSLGELSREKYLRWSAGAKYSAVSIAAMLDGEGPFEVNAAVTEGCLDVRMKAEDFKRAEYYGHWQRDLAAWIPPEGSVSTDMDLSRAPVAEKHKKSFFTLELRMALAENLNKEFLDATEYSPFTVRINGIEVQNEPVAFRTDSALWKVQFIEFIEISIPADVLKKGKNILTIENHGSVFLVLVSAQLRERIESHFQVIHSPTWLLTGDEFEISVRALMDDKIIIRGINFELPDAPVSLKEGMNNIKLKAGRTPGNMLIHLNSEKITVPVYLLEREEIPWLVGGVLLNVKHDGTDEVSKAIKYLYSSQMGNYVQFRLAVGADRGIGFAAPLASWRKWALLCKKYGISFSMNAQQILGNVNGIKEQEGDIVKRPFFYKVIETMEKAAPDNFISIHIHELEHWLYCHIPGRFESGTGAKGTMADAMRKFIKDKRAIDIPAGIARQSGQATALAFTDYEAGFDIVSVETMAFNASHLLAGAHGAARAYDKKRWGVYNAVYWCKTPEDFTKLTLSYLNWYSAYLWGGDMAINEDGHFRISHSGHQQGWNSEETSCIRQIMRDFYHFVSTHPRQGKPQINIAVAQGNLSSEIISFPLKFANAKKAVGNVWGAKGGLETKWDYGDPERGMELLDVFMPYHQDGENIRHWFTGTPYGIFDMTPIAKVPQEVLNSYKLLVFLGWNSITPEIYDKLENYVEQGGMLFMALPHLAMHEDRQFLLDMEDLNLINRGDFSKLFGLEVKDKGTEKDFICHWRENAAQDGFPGWKEYKIKTPVANIKLKTAKALMAGKIGNVPVLTENTLGKGKAYLLTTWAYPGHPSLMDTVRDILYALADKSKGGIYLEDHSQEVAWSVWREKDGLSRIYMLNTDWTELDNRKKCRLAVGKNLFPVTVTEGEMLTATVKDDLAFLNTPDGIYIESINAIGEGKYEITIHGCGRMPFIFCHSAGNSPELKIKGKKISLKQTGKAGFYLAEIDFAEMTKLQVSLDFFKE